MITLFTYVITLPFSCFLQGKSKLPLEKTGPKGSESKLNSVALWKCKQDHIRERQQFIYQMQNVLFLVRWKRAWITGGVHLSRAAVKPDTLPTTSVSTICSANLCSPLSPLLFHSHPPLSPPSFPHPPWLEPTLRGCALPISVSHLSLWVTGAGICWV